MGLVVSGFSTDSDLVRVPESLWTPLPRFQSQSGRYLLYNRGFGSVTGMVQRFSVLILSRTL